MDFLIHPLKPVWDVYFITSRKIFDIKSIASILSAPFNRKQPDRKYPARPGM